MKTILNFLVAFAFLPVAALGNDDDDGKSLQPAEVNAKWRQECGSCHIAYPPGLLPAESWRQLMSGLDKHFGTDASLTAPEVKEITDFLVKNASSRWKAPTAPLRITETRWFKSEHDEVPSHLWQHPAVKSPANCPACHVDADKGDFREKGIRLPK